MNIYKSYIDIENKEPPKKYITLLAHRATRLEYSAIKIREKYKPAYSVLYPATNSASASDKSNGALLVSAIAVIIKIKLRGNKGTPL